MPHTDMHTKRADLSGRLLIAKADPSVANCDGLLPSAFAKSAYVKECLEEIVSIVSYVHITYYASHIKCVRASMYVSCKSSTQLTGYFRWSCGPVHRWPATQVSPLGDNVS